MNTCLYCENTVPEDHFFRICDACMPEKIAHHEEIENLINGEPTEDDLRERIANLEKTVAMLVEVNQMQVNSLVICLQEYQAKIVKLVERCASETKWGFKKK